MGNLLNLNSCFLFLLLGLSIIEIGYSIESDRSCHHKERQLVGNLNSLDIRIKQKRKQIKAGINGPAYIDQKSRSNLSDRENFADQHKNNMRKIHKNILPFRISNLRQSLQQTLSFDSLCQIPLQLNTKYHFITSAGEQYLFLNEDSSQSLLIYNMNCQMLVKIKTLQVQFVFEQEKQGNYPNNKQAEHQLVYFISKKSELVVVDIAQVKKLAQVNNKHDLELTASQINKLYRILNNKLTSSNQNDRIIGVMMKTTLPSPSNRQKQSKSGTYREKSLFIAYELSQIKVFDQMGGQKLTMKQHSPINDLFAQSIQNKSTLQSIPHDISIQLIDHHPYPLLLQSSWVYLIDTSKYTRQVWACPYIPNIKKLFVQSLHSNEVYVLTTDKILKINVKSKENANVKKGSCQIERRIDYFNSELNKKNVQDIVFSVNKNLIFLNDMVFNMTSNQFSTVRSPESLLAKRKIPQGKEEQCKSFSLNLHQIINSPKKSPSSKESILLLQCKNQNSSSLQVFPISSTRSQSSILIYISLAFVFVIFLAIKFFKSNTSNYEKQLLYPINLSAEEKQIRKENYEKLNKYIEEARRLDQEQAKRNSSKEQKSNTEKMAPKETIKGKNVNKTKSQ